jgi:hypothetical protein
MILVKRNAAARSIKRVAHGVTSFLPGMGEQWAIVLS